MVASQHQLEAEVRAAVGKRRRRGGRVHAREHDLEADVRAPVGGESSQVKSSHLSEASHSSSLARLPLSGWDSYLWGSGGAVLSACMQGRSKASLLSGWGAVLVTPVAAVHEHIRGRHPAALHLIPMGIGYDAEREM